MATTITAAFPSHLPKFEEETQRLVSHRLTRNLVPIGRCLFALLFLKAAPLHFTEQGIAYAAFQGVPMPQVLVPLAGALALLGGLSVALGYQARLGGALIALFLVPVTLQMHAFWNVTDPTQAMFQEALFWKNVSMLGAALIFAHFGAGPISLDARKYKHRAEEFDVAAPEQRVF